MLCVVLLVGAVVGSEKAADDAPCDAGEAKAKDSPGCGCGSTNRQNIVNKDAGASTKSEEEGDNKSTLADSVDGAEEVDLKSTSEKYSAEANKEKELPRTNQMVYVQVGF